MHNERDGALTLTTLDGTDFWQRTHYGFSRDDGHALLTSLHKDFQMTVRVRYSYEDQYDQCGLLVRIDALNWIKLSSERESQDSSRLGSVVTNLGYSDWATTDVNGTEADIWYRVECRENDFHLYTSQDGADWHRLRIAHLHSRQRPLNVGIYACSPKKGGFQCQFSDFSLNPPKEKNH